MNVSTKLIIITCLTIGCTNQRPTLTPELWQEDLEQLHAEMLRRHPDPLRKSTAAQIDSAFQDVAGRAALLSPHEMVVEIMRLAALFGDGHTSFFPEYQAVASFNYIPVRFWAFEEGIYPLAVGSDLTRCLHRKLIRVGTQPIDEVLNQLSQLVAADNEMEYTYTIPDLLIRPEILFALGIADSAATVRFTFEGDDGSPLVVDFPVVTVQEYDNAVQWVAARDDLGSVPSITLRRLFSNSLNATHLVEDYWFQAIDSLETVYLEYNKSVYLEDAGPLYATFDALFRLLDAHPEYRLIIDLRNNPGGEPRTADSLIRGIQARPRLLMRGKVLTLVSRRTYSAATTNATHLRRFARSVIIGEHSRGRPNSPSEGRDIVLKHSDAIVTVSTEMVMRDPDLLDADYLPLDIQVNTTYADYRRGIDRGLETALQHHD